MTEIETIEIAGAIRPACPARSGRACHPGPNRLRPKLCCRQTPVDEPLGFQIYRRNEGHWDVSGIGGRLFRIRGEPGDVRVYDERVFPGEDPDRPHRRPELPPFPTINLAVAWIAATLMREPGQP